MEGLLCRPPVFITPGRLKPTLRPGGSGGGAERRHRHLATFDSGGEGPGEEIGGEVATAVTEGRGIERPQCRPTLLIGPGRKRSILTPGGCGGGAERRRGRPTARRQLAAPAAEKGWPADTESRGGGSLLCRPPVFITPDRLKPTLRPGGSGGGAERRHRHLAMFDSGGEGPGEEIGGEVATAATEGRGIEGSLCRPPVPIAPGRKRSILRPGGCGGGEERRRGRRIARRQLRQQRRRGGGGRRPRRVAAWKVCYVGQLYTSSPAAWAQL